MDKAAREESRTSKRNLSDFTGDTMIGVGILAGREVGV